LVLKREAPSMQERVKVFSSFPIPRRAKKS
jgi:hypothetical protein